MRIQGDCFGKSAVSLTHFRRDLIDDAPRVVVDNQLHDAVFGDYVEPALS